MVSKPGCFTFDERAPGIHWMGGWLDATASLYAVEKRKTLSLLGIKPQILYLVAILIELCSMSHYKSTIQIFYMIIISFVDISTSVCVRKFGTTFMP